MPDLSKSRQRFKLKETAALLREKAEPIIHLGGGEPKTKAPVDAIINCASLLNTGEVRYTAPAGIPALKKAIIRYTEEHYKKIVSAKNVIASGGAKQALMVLLHASLDAKEEVVFPAPYGRRRQLLSNGQRIFCGLTGSVRFP